MTAREDRERFYQAGRELGHALEDAKPPEVRQLDRTIDAVLAMLEEESR
jgi:hypothetical protein